MLSEKKLIKRLQRYNVAAQKELYERYAVTFKRMCLNYVNQDTDADDILQEGFIKILKNINQFKGDGSFEGWMKRIIINTALKEYKKNKQKGAQLDFSEIQETKILNNNFDDDLDKYIDAEDIDKNVIDYTLIEKAEFSKKELMEAIDQLKPDFKIVFHLFFMENYKHQEIAKMLDIDEKTSRSRLSRARKVIQHILYSECIKRVSV